MYAGEIYEVGCVDKISSEPLHPYTKLLLEAIPDVEKPRMQLKSMPGIPPDMRSLQEDAGFGLDAHTLWTFANINLHPSPK